MIKNKFFHLDCTLRDGGYYNNWNFGSNLIQRYLNIMAEINIDYVEIGFRSLDNKELKGPCAYSTDEFINSFKIPKKLNIAVMINASEIVRYSSEKKNIDIVKKLFKKLSKSKIKLVRIASHYYEIEKLTPIIKKIKSLGYKIALNLMQISDRSDFEIKNFCTLAKKNKVDVIYFADSTGSLDREKTKKISQLFKNFWNGDLGIHSHDNMDKAMENAITALNNGVNWVDSTVLGMGRGPGNIKTENLLIELGKKQKKKINLTNLLRLVDDDFEKMKNKYRWGSNPYYYLSGMYGIHPTFVQTMLEIKSFTSSEILTIIDHLKTIGGKQFSKDLIATYKQNFTGSSNGTYIPEKNLKNKEVLIIGSGPGIKKNKKNVKKYIKINKPFVIVLNSQKNINSKLINLRVLCNILRLLTDHQSFKYLPQKLVLPYQRLSNSIKKKFQKVKKLDFGVEIKNNTFKFKKSSAIIPNSLAISYALAIANSGKAKRVYLAGFDGYDINNPKRLEMDQLFLLYNSLKSKCEILSITPTEYKIKSKLI